METKNFYKLNRFPSLAEALARRTQNNIAERQEKRREFFWGSRIDLNKSPPHGKNLNIKKNTRAEMLKKWKAEKLKKEEEEKRKRKPVFKVGILQRKATGSPVLGQKKNFLKKIPATQKTQRKLQKNNVEVEKQGVLTRAKAKDRGLKPEVKPVYKEQNKFYKIEAGKKKQINSHVFKVPETVSKLSCKGLTFPYSPKLRSKNSQKLLGEKVKEEKSESGKVGNLKAESGLMDINLQTQLISPERKVIEEMQQENCFKGNEAEENKERDVNVQPQLMSPERKVVETDNYRPIIYTPFVTVRSGRKSKRKSKKSLSMDVEEQIKVEEDKFKCRIFSFRKYIEDEKRRLLEMCDKWKHIYEDFQEIPLEVEGDIDSVIGKTNLLTSDKFMQFKGLIEKCENGDPFVKVDDLQGFQDWVSIEVERIDEEFHKLEMRKCNGWESETVTINVTKVQKPKITKKLPKKPVGTSNIRSHILAARKLLKEKNAEVKNESQVAVSHFESSPRTPMQKENSLKDVVNSEMQRKSESSNKKSLVVREKRNSGLEIMMATQKNKFPTPIKLQKSPLLTDYEIIVNKDEIPRRSILKKTPKTANSAKGHVTFKRNPENLVNRGRNLSERYFQPLMDDDMSPIRTVLGDLGNLTPSRMKTRSWTKQMSQPGLSSPLVN